MRDTVYVIPASFGLGPASLALAAGQALRETMPRLRLIGAADDFSFEFLATNHGLDEVIECPPGKLPDQLAGRADKSVAVFFGDFDRPAAAIAAGIPTGVVDALYWMWDQDPMDPRTVDFYLALAFPGVEERIREQGDIGAAVDVIPQIVYRDKGRRAPVTQRSGVLVNLGGAMSPFGANHAYLRALLQVVARASAPHSDNLAVCSAAAAAELSAIGEVPMELRSLTTAQMLHELDTRALLLTVPGQSIIWESLQAGIPMIVLPGANYSQHRQTPAYREFIDGVPFTTWNDLDGYHELPIGLAEADGVAQAARLGGEFAGDPQAQERLCELLRQSWGQADPPRLRPGSPWSSLNGADHVVRRTAALLERGA